MSILSSVWKTLTVHWSLLLSVVLSTTAELVRSADSQVPLWTYWIWTYILTRSPEDSRAHSSHQGLHYIVQKVHFPSLALMLLEHLLCASSVRLLSHVRLFAAPWTAAVFPVHHQLPGGCSNSCPLSWWCHLTISSSVVPFSSCLQSFPASGSFPMCKMLG